MASQQKARNLEQKDQAWGLAVILLAAGESTRMKQPKQLLAWQGTTLLQYQVAQACGLEATEVIVVLGERAGDLRPLTAGFPRARVIENDDYRSGKTSSIRAGLGAITSHAQAVMVLAVDQPRPAALLNTLVRQHLASGALISVPTYQGKRGHPPVFSTELMPDLLAISEERFGLREVLQRRESGIREVEIDSPLLLTNLNTDEDYQKALAMSNM